MAYKKCDFKDGETVITADCLNAMQDAICDMEKIVELHPQNKNNPHGVTAEQVGAHPNTWMPSADQVGARPNTWMPSASDVGARPENWMPNASDVGAVPTTRKVNEKPLNEDISLSAADVGAVPTSRKVNGKTLSTDITLNAADVGTETRELLWVNANTGYPFPAQTIPLDLSAYDAIEVVGFVNYPPSNTFSSGIVPVGNNGAINGFSSDFWMQSRAFTTNSTGVTFESGTMKEPNAGLYKEWDDRSIPYKIYGIKEVR